MSVKAIEIESYSGNTDHMYVNLMRAIVKYGDNIQTRNSKVKRLTNAVFVFDKTPLVSIRTTAWKSAIEEMRWFLSGSNNIKDLKPTVQEWWKPWADKQGVVKFNYGEQLRAFATHCDDGLTYTYDQLSGFVKGVKEHSFSRRNIMTTWHAADMNDSRCPITNCHGTIIQAFGRENGALDITMYQRSVDVVCGLPHNWIQYWAFLKWLSYVTGHTPGVFTWIGGDVHIYSEHFDLVHKMSDLYNTQKGDSDSPQLMYHPEPNTDTQYRSTVRGSYPFRVEDFQLDRDYRPLCNDKAKMIV